MTETLGTSVLRRKLAPRASPPPAQDGVGDGPARGIVRSFARAVSDCAPLLAEKGVRAQRRLSLAELIDSVDPDAFVALLAGEDGPPGLAVIDQTGFAALVEAMTIGRLAPREPASRRATATDAALLGEVLNAALSGLDAGDPARGLSIRQAVPDNRLLPVLLEDVPHVLVTLDAALLSGPVQRAARLALALPQVPVVADAAAGGAVSLAPGVPGGACQGWAQALETAVMAAPATLRAELGRITLPLAEVLALGEGGMLTLPLSNLEEVRLVALDGTVQATGRLGQSRGMRALRLTNWPGGAPPDPAQRFDPARAAHPDAAGRPVAALNAATAPQEG